MLTCKVLFFLLLALSCGKCDVLYRQVGGEAAMKCEVAQDSNVEWKFNNVLVIHINGKRGTRRIGDSPIKEKISVSGGTLKVPRLEQKDSGVYFCSQSEKRYTLYVVSVFAKPALLSASSEATLHCEITGNPDADVKWLGPSDEEINDKKQVIQLKSVTSKEDGQWTCVVNDGSRFSLTLTVVDLQTNNVEVSEGGKIVLPCSLSKLVSQHVVGGKWTADHLSTDFFPTLTNSASKGLHWNGGNASKVTFASGQLGNSFNVTLIKAQRKDEGNFVCTVKFEGGLELTAKTYLTVVPKPSDGQKSSKGKGAKPAGGGTWTMDVFGLQLWIWIAVSSAVLLGLTILTVLVLLRNKRMRRMKRLRSMRQPLTAKDYCKCKRAEIEVELGQREKPLLAPRQQRNPRTRAAGHDYTIEKSKAQDYRA